MYIVRPLARPPGWMIGASFRTEELGKLYSASWFGNNALAGIVDLKNGGLQTIVGPAARHPERGLGKTELFANMVRSPDGIWIGESPIDGVLRIHAYHRVPNRDMTVVVAATDTEAMQSATLFAAGARGVAFAATATVLMITGVIAWTLYHFRANRRREVILTRNETELARLHQDEERLTERAQLQSARLRAMVENVSDGIALVDPDLRLIRWNRRFEQGIGVPLEQNMPLDAILRHQAMLGLFDPPPADVEVEVARRVADLRSGETAVAQIAIGAAGAVPARPFSRGRRADPAAHRRGQLAGGAARSGRPGRGRARARLPRRWSGRIGGGIDPTGPDAWRVRLLPMGKPRHTTVADLALALSKGGSGRRGHSRPIAAIIRLARR